VLRGLRGGSFDNNDNNLRADNRNNNDPANENNNIGFRVASSPWPGRSRPCRSRPEPRR
jgi:formylglycine-generating enzyme required for sulfatase activity